jgi:photosystem II stability/assembly factor-like uncharacterized protein
MLSKPGKYLVLFALFILFALAACSKNKPAPSLTSSAVVSLLETATPTATAIITTYPLADTAMPYPAPGQPASTPGPIPAKAGLPTDTVLPYPPPGHLVVTPGPSPTRYPTPTRSQTPIPSPTHIRLPTDSSTETPMPVRIVQIWMFDAHTGWAVDSNGNIQRTTNGTQSWKNTTPPVAEGYRCPTASFLDVNTAIAGCIHSYLPNSGKFEITTWRTLDAGRTWESGELISSDRVVMAEVHILMLDSEKGWMLGIGEGSMGHSPISFLSTRDGGMHWKQDYKTTQGSELELLSFYGVYPYQDDFAITSETNGFFSNGNLYSSTDGGETWAPFTLEAPADLPELNCTSDYGQCKYLDTISAPRFKSSQDGVLIRRVYTNTEYVGYQFSNTYSIHQLPLPGAQYLYFTDNGGQTWTPRLSPASLGTVYFLDMNTGWFLGKSDIDPTTPTQLYQTTDSGETWSQISADCPVPLGSEFQFADEQAGFAFDNYETLQYYYNMDFRIWEALTHAYLFYTQDGGRTWAKVVPQLTP